ncbi:MAG: hypothetical protein AUH72_09315 [Acidobacteria bacterium 13_1_40CM_4_65_8]|nr:MAG: hypothetical protein AUH72_09315 [Acidobacteria bacterium 13_1_40CM_4_65_8]
MKRDRLPPLWSCPKCGAKFVSANMWHSCGRYRLEDLFATSEPHVFKMFQKFKRMVESCGPVTMIPQKTRVVFMVRMRFAGATVRKTNLRVGLILERKLPDDPRIEKIDTFSPHSHGHYFRIDRANQLDKTMLGWIREAHDSGTQKHFERRGNAVRREKPGIRR